MLDLKTMQQQAESGDAAAQFALAEALKRGATGDLPKAMSWYFKAASSGHVEAQLRLGLMLLDDVAKAGGKRNPQQAHQWLLKAAQAGNLDAQCRLGLLLLDGDGVAGDAAAGIRWLECAAIENNAGAQYALGYRLVTGQGMEADRVRGMQHLLAAARQDHADAMFHFAMLVEHGIGLDAADPALAARMYNRAVIMHGHAGAAQNFGIMHVTGKGVERDVLLAKTLLEFAIGAGVEAAMFDLGLWLMREEELRDCATAAMWATLSLQYCADGKGASRAA